MVRFGVIGYGYWGPNIVRNINGINPDMLAAVCDKSEKNLGRVKKAYPDVHVTTDASELLTDPTIDAIAVVTPVWTHFDLARRALQNGKHLFIEKPFTATAHQAEELIELAERNHLTIMVDHTFLFTGAVRKIRELIDNNTLGKLYYYDSMRVNLGLFQHDVNVLWDLAPHDLSIVDYLIGREAEAVIATGAGHLNGHADVAYMTIYFPDSVIAHLNVNWLSPVKVRTTLIGGENKMLVWNDLEVDEKIKIYDRGVKITNQEGVYDALVSYRSGDMYSPKVEATEALKLELTYFLECVESGKRPFNDGQSGLRVVRMLEAAESSLKRKGEAVCA
ncbi:Gfo/Idh/MocA family protein [Paludibaculum fermentans]|uniref:Gfo/Idh/MocA family protein n=1 Tax=Paludibaculum fermentans TaxID=1473598 RepID=UPI003EBB7FE1